MLNENHSYKIIKTLTIIVMIVILIGCNSQREEKKESPVTMAEIPGPQERVVEVEKGTIRKSITGRGQVVSEQEESLYFNEGGEVDEVLVEYGDRVEKGELLISLEVEDLKHDYERAKIRYEKVKQEKEQMERYVGEIVSEYEYKFKKLEYKEEKLRKEQIEQSLENAKLKAPFSGEIISIQVSEEENIGAFTEVITLVDPHNLTIELEVSDADLRRLAPGIEAEVRPEGGYWVDAYLSFVPSPLSGNNNVQVQIKDIEKIMEEHEITAEEIIERRDLVRVEIILLENRNTLLVPEEVIREDGDRTFVRISDGDLRTEVDIKTGLEEDGKVEILKGLKEGDKVLQQ